MRNQYLIDGLLADASYRSPETVAVHADGQSLTYAQLDLAAERVAGALAEMGVRRGDRVGLYVNKTVDALAAVYGTMRTGAAYVPLDPHAPAARCAMIARDCQIAALIADERGIEELRRLDSTVAKRGVVCGDTAPNGFETWRAVQSGSQVAPSRDVVDTDLAYILYTSGSTGRPKGVMISHRNCLTFINWARGELGLRPDDTLSNHAPFHFDLSTFDLFGAASVGATVSMVPATTALFPIELAKWIKASNVTVWYSVPSALSLLVRSGSLTERPIDSIRLMLFAGEVFPNKYLAELMRLVPKAQYFNLYGPTETNVCTFQKVDSPPKPDQPPIPIGRACANTRCFIVDHHGNEVTAQDQEGELVVQGSIVAQGYWGDPARTAQKFTDPYTYRTGDIVRWADSSDGPVLRFIGRRDHMVKSRGYRIELGEIESVLNSHPDVEEAAAVAVPDELFGNQIVAFCAVRRNDDEAKLKQLCKERLPFYMVPAKIILLDILPRTLNGKVDRTTLVDTASLH